MTPKNIQITAITSVGSLIGMVLGAWLFADSYFAHADDVLLAENRTVQTIQSLRVQIVLDELSRLEAKKSNAMLSTYEKVRHKQLEKLFELLTMESK